MKLFSPVSGTVLSLESVPDPVFAGLMLGPGFAIQPTGPGLVTIGAPLSGIVKTARAHAVIIDSCLVHAGVDTFKSDGLKSLITKDERVEIGTPIITMDLDRLGDLSSAVMVTFPEYEKSAWHQLVAPGTPVTAGTLLGTLD